MLMPTVTGANRENLGPAERIIQTLLAYQDHMQHNRLGIVRPDRGAPIGVKWDPVTYRMQADGTKLICRLYKLGPKPMEEPLGLADERGVVRQNGAIIGEFREAGLYPEVAEWFYSQVAEVWKLDNEFAARWGSFAFPQEHKDLKVVLTAFLLCQNRSGAPIMDAGKCAFYDADFRAVGEAMTLLHLPGGHDLDPKLVLRVQRLLSLPCITRLNHQLGFSTSTRHPFYGRWKRAVRKWLDHRAANPKLLASLVKAGYRRTIMELTRQSGYVPSTPAFYAALRWKQQQAKTGHRTLAIGAAVTAAETWTGLTEIQICERIVREQPGWKRLSSLLPPTPGLTRAIMTAAIEAGCIGDRDLVILTPTLEDLGLLTNPTVKTRWERATAAATDQRAANIARNVKSIEVKQQLQQAADAALQTSVKEVLKGLRLYVLIDISGSMHQSIPAAQRCLIKLLPAFPLDQIHVAVFNTSAREVRLPAASTAGITAAFHGLAAGGGTDYGAGVRLLGHYAPRPDEDALVLFVGDEGQSDGRTFTAAFRDQTWQPCAFALLKLPSQDDNQCVQRTAQELHIPCFPINERTFDDDPYAIPRTLRSLIAATPVTRGPTRPTPVRQTLIEQILKTELLAKPVWA
jgi:von Willebrand factor type A domain